MPYKRGRMSLSKQRHDRWGDTIAYFSPLNTGYEIRGMVYEVTTVYDNTVYPLIGIRTIAIDELQVTKIRTLMCPHFPSPGLEKL